jgi:hypothetical protein
MQNNKNMKKKEAKSCKNVALLFLDDNKMFFLNNEVNCWYSNGNPCTSSMFFPLFFLLLFFFFLFFFFVSPFLNSEVREIQPALKKARSGDGVQG